MTVKRNVPTSSFPLIPSALLTLILAGCATVPPPEQQDASELLVRTSGGVQRNADDSRFRNDLPPPPPPPAQTSRSKQVTTAAATPRTVAGRGTTSDNQVMLNFVDADLQGVVRALARFTGKNFIVDPRVKGQLTLVSEAPLSPQTAYTMLLGALRMQGFAVVEVDGVSRVVPEADAKLQGSPVSAADGTVPSSGLVTRVFSLRYENAANLVPVLRPMIAPNNPINAYPGNNTLVITDYADNLDRIAQVIAGIDTPHSINTDVVPIRYAIAADIAGLASQLLEGQGGSGDATQRISVVADPRTNSVLIRAGSPARLDLAKELIQRIDSPTTKPGNLHVVYLRNAQATKLAEVLRGALTGQGGSSTGSEGLSNTSGLSSSSSNSSSSSSRSANSLLGTSSNNSSGNTSSSGSSNNQQSVAFSAGGATIQADPSTNTLIISAPDPLYRSLREVIDQLDQRRAQVLVESLIVEVNADNSAEFGIQWMVGGDSISSGNTSFVGGSNLGGSGLTGNGPTTIDALGKGLSLGVVKGTVDILGNEVLNLGVLARAMEGTGQANVLSTPNLMTLDNEEASIMVGKTVPFVTGQYTTSGDGSSNPFQTIEREDVGLTLRIRPQISEGGTVKLALYQEVSNIDDAASTSSSSIVTRKRSLETNVLVDDGQIIVLGGLLEDNVSNTTVAVPLLGSIPFIGNLFRYDKRTRTKTNLMVFLRPHIVRDARDSASLTLDRYNFMRAAQNNMPLESRWLTPDDSRPLLPELDRNDAGLLDLRDDSPAPASPVTAEPQVILDNTDAGQ
ncbi:type II secretion system secretin GspD [Kerstersia gyiorum]|uniref:type II secretion system secretin GspD n=1 Tax=Kerstersia gyiorum TaxID=206506 RepID=UPI00209D2E99|nr:type II secretion system secretin GspD [Kerstersia gyiorum]MCP1672120.1 general secretion pathway protein D [Kerstersia gyiorum]MCP1710189.1 general secretion pathway protein D [Kerstersia gyiorum]